MDELYDIMHRISEENWCAGWLIGLEYILWEDIHSKESQFCTEREKRELLDLSSKYGWCIWGNGEPQLISLRKWEDILKKWRDIFNESK